MRCLKFQSLNPTEKKLLRAAEKALIHAYNPYSNSYVGAAVLTETKDIISAASIATASSSVNLCAERCAIAAANSHGHRHLIALAIIGRAKDHDYDEPITPCGVCRQFLFEFDLLTKGDFKVICSNSKKTKIYRFTLEELFPYPYSRYKKSS